MRLTLAGRIFAVTGAAQGIGRAIVLQLLASGARVAALDIDADGLARLPAHDDLRLVVADLGERQAALDAIGQVAEAFGGLDGLVCAAGGVRGQVGRPLGEIGEADWAAIQAANVSGTLWCAQAALPHLTASDVGRLVTISSGAGLRPSLTGIQAYTAAKHALVGLTRQLALEFGPFGITVNSVAPGFVLSNPSTQRQWEAFGPERQRQIVEGIHLKRLGTAEDIANAVLFLVSREAGWITGQILSVDGGRA